jgi:hypothetical protein
MIEFTRPATWDDLMGLARALQATAHGYNRFSEVVDLLVDPRLRDHRPQRPFCHSATTNSPLT